MTLAEFLRSRIAEDEAAAREAIAWREKDRPDFEGPDMERPQAWPDTSLACVLVGPEFVLAECDAKQRIVALHPNSDEDTRTEWAFVMDGDGFEVRYDPCGTCGGDRAPEEWPCLTLRLLALPHAAHPDYLEEWQP